MENLVGLVLWVVLLAALVVFVFWPRRGLLARYRTAQQAAQRQQVEDALKLIINTQLDGHSLTAAGLGSALEFSADKTAGLLQRMRSQQLVEPGDSALTLTAEGRRWALQVIRAHRLWERYLADEARMPLPQIHEMAHQREHGMTAQEINDLDAALGYPRFDPHGDPIPDAAGDLLAQPELTHVSDMAVGARGRVAHLEDEPPLAYAQLLALGLTVGQSLVALEKTPNKIVLSDGENEYALAPAIAANVSLYLEDPAAEPAETDIHTLTQLKTTDQAEIVSLADTCQGFTRRRFLDLGLTPGTKISPELDNAFGDPRAYRVRGTLIALRSDQADMILVQPVRADE